MYWYGTSIQTSIHYSIDDKQYWTLANTNSAKHIFYLESIPNNYDYKRKKTQKISYNYQDHQAIIS